MAADRHDQPAAQTRVRVDFRQVREALTAVDQASTVFEGLLVACVELQDENERLARRLDLAEGHILARHYEDYQEAASDEGV